MPLGPWKPWRLPSCALSSLVPSFNIVYVTAIIGMYDRSWNVFQLDTNRIDFEGVSILLILFHASYHINPKLFVRPCVRNP